MKLWDLAGKIYLEAIFQGQMLAAGSNVHRLTERLKSDARYITKQGRLVQVLGSVYLLVVAFLSVVAFIELRTGSTGEWNFFVATISVSTQLVIQAGYLMMLTVLATAEILAPDLYRWFESLPLSRDQIGSLKILALAREFVLPLGVMVLSTPIVAGVAGGSLLAGAVGLVVGTMHAAVTLALAVLASWRLRRVLRASEANDRTSRIVRIVTMLVYGLGTLLVVFIMQLGSNGLAALFNAPGLTPGLVAFLLRALAVVPLPSAPAVLLTSLVSGANADALPLWMPLVGTGLYGVLALVLLRRVRALVHGRPAVSRRRHDAPAVVEETRASEIRVRAPRRIFRRQIGQAMTRDTQAFVSMTFPVLIPLLGAIGPAVSGGGRDVAITMSLVMASTVGSWMVIHGLTRLQFGSSGLEQTLPVRERDRVFPRLVLAALLPTLGAMLPPLILLAPGSPEQLAAFASALCVAVVAPAGLLLKLFLFGRVRTGSDPIVLDEVRTRARFWKWAAVVGLLFVLGAGIVAGRVLLVTARGTWSVAVLPGAAAFVGLVEIAVARRMFR